MRIRRLARGIPIDPGSPVYGGNVDAMIVIHAINEPGAVEVYISTRRERRFWREGHSIRGFSHNLPLCSAIIHPGRKHLNHRMCCGWNTNCRQRNRAKRRGNRGIIENHLARVIFFKLQGNRRRVAGMRPISRLQTKDARRRGRRSREQNLHLPISSGGVGDNGVGGCLLTRETINRFVYCRFS